jgi:general secretion pathway protein G
VAWIKRVFCSLAAIIIVLVDGLILLCVLLALPVWFTGTRCHSRVLQARAQICTFYTALGAYWEDVGGFPDTLDALSSDPGVSGWRGPYLTKGVPLDPWGHPYVYVGIAAEHRKW